MIELVECRGRSLAWRALASPEAELDPLGAVELVGELMAPILRRIMSVELEGSVRLAPNASKLAGASMAIYILENR